MYSVLKEKKAIPKSGIIANTKILDIEGFLMASNHKTFFIHDSKVRKIRIMDKELANPIASKKAFQKYHQLIALITELLIDDDDSGDGYREALNQIERFRLEIKNKYRAYLKRVELEKMSRQLTVLQKEASKKLLEIQYTPKNYENESKRSR